MKALCAGQREEQPNTKKQSAWSRRHFVRVVGRSVFAIALAAALVVSDALPVPTGLPDTVEAAGPSKGTITFYKYTPITSFNEISPGDDRWRDTLMMYQRDGDWYAPNSKILATDNWPVGKVNGVLPHFNESGSFYSRVKSYQRRWCHSDWWVCTKPLFFKSVGSDGSVNILGHYDGNKIYPSDNGDLSPFEVSNWRNSSGFCECAIRYIYTHNDNKAWGFYLAGDKTHIWGQGSGDQACWFRMYNVETYKYTCIKSNYTIGDNQVYVADRDLFLKEDVKLTIPEGSVLCVKNGPFYVNGEIECYGTILVEDGGIIMPYESESGGSRIVMKEGGAMIIRHGGKVYAGCPKDSLWTKGDNGWLDMYEGSSIINFGLFVAGKCNFKYGQATIENHKGGRMYLGYSINNNGEYTFLNADFHYSVSSSGGNIFSDMATVITAADMFETFYLDKAGATVNYGQGSKQTVIKTWDGARTCFANKATSAGQTVKLYTYDKDGKCAINSSYSPD